MTLYFLRHGIAVEEGDWPGEDFDRPLSHEGMELLSREARGMADLALGIGLILASPYLRAWQSAEIAARGLGLLGALERAELLSPGFDAKKLAALLAGQARAKALLLVGHEPDFSRTIGKLIGGGRVSCKKGSLLRLELDELAPPRGELLWSLPAAVLARIGRD
jgi:phosphohistidine phosphatase